MSPRTMKSGWILALAAAAIAAPAGAGADTEVRLQEVVPVSTSTTGFMTLYDQTDSPAGAGFASQVFEPANAGFDCRAADDFTVSVADVQWDIGGLTTLGAYVGGAGPTPRVDVEFFADAGGLPAAAPSCSYLGLVAGVDFTDAAGNLTITLPSPCSLTAGTYWVSVRADMDLAVGGQWLWQMRSVQSSAQFAWENPADGFGTGCTSWTPGTACGAVGVDLLYSLDGVVVPVDLQSVTVE